jgi:hypothetical protein
MYAHKGKGGRNAVKFDEIRYKGNTLLQIKSKYQRKEAGRKSFQAQVSVIP